MEEETPDMLRIASNIEMLTSDTGPLVQLVREVRKSNRLASTNQRWLRWVLISMVVCLFSLARVVYLLPR